MKSLRDYQSAKEWLYSLKNQGSTYGLERMEVLAEELRNPQLDFPVVHVAGTNGKGSTCAILDTIFREHGFRVGLSTSPHLVRQGERIQVDRKILEESSILEYTREIAAIGERIAVGNADMHPSFFEFMTAMAFLHFARSEIDVAVVEVGLGGRLDATNVVDPEICVITSIALDHCEILGDSLRKIAREKGGIIKPGKPVVIGFLPKEAEDEITSICRELGSPLYSVKEAYGEGLGHYPSCSLSGDYQKINAGIAVLVCKILKERFDLKDEIVGKSLAKVNWPGRWQEFALASRKGIFDVSHNSEGAYWLEKDMAKLADAEGAPDVVMGVMGGYRAEALMPVVARYARSITFVVPAQSRACSFEEMESFIPESFKGEVRRSSVSEIFPRKGVCSLDVPERGPLLITGSIYLIGEVWEHFFEESPVGGGALQDF
ncbi:bifunctional folylpolyglutamate synthase/dihydrofolate synthase [Puniceicoccaceae bacterium K14]|nr:bifunctional folylpolyglutamate synthase/dihydrofolate synthase [Puniceicoccaceae bacterium K14]